MSVYKFLKTAIFSDGDMKCIEKLAGLIVTGKLIEAFRTDREEMVACTITAFGTLLLAAGGWLHRKQDGDDEPGPFFSTQTTEDEAQSSILLLGDALGVKPVMAGPITEGFYALVLQAFLTYLQASIPDIIKAIKDLADDANG